LLFGLLNQLTVEKSQKQFTLSLSTQKANEEGSVDLFYNKGVSIS